MLRPNNNQLYSDYVSLLIPTEYLQYLRILLTINLPWKSKVPLQRNGMAASPKILEWSKLLESYCKIVHTFKNRQVFLVLRLQTPHASMVFFRILYVRLKCIDHKRQLLNFFLQFKTFK